MSGPSLPVADLWLSALDKLDLEGAVVFADDRAVCALSWAVGLAALLERGVHNVLRLGDRLDGGCADTPGERMGMDTGVAGGGEWGR